MVNANSEIPRLSVKPARWRQRSALLVVAMLPGLLAACSRSEHHDYSAAPLVPVARAAVPPARADGWISHVSAKPTSR